MDLFEQTLSESFPAHKICRAFLCSRFSGAPSVEQALGALQNYDSIFIQPMLVSRGPTYEKLRTLSKNHPVGVPLLDSPCACVDALRQWLPAPLLLMGHGSAETDFSDFIKILSNDLHFAAMEGTPALEEVLPLFAGRSLHLAPFLLTAGTHGTRDLALWKEKLEAIGCSVTVHPESLAHCPQIRDLFARHVQRQILQFHSPTEKGKDVSPCIRD